MTLLELFNIVGFGIEKKETSGKGSLFKYFQFFKIWFSLEDIEDNPDGRIREQSESNPKTWQEKIRGDKYEEDKHIFQYKPLP